MNNVADRFGDELRIAANALGLLYHESFNFARWNRPREIGQPLGHVGFVDQIAAQAFRFVAHLGQAAFGGRDSVLDQPRFRAIV